jgi:hypothetical protein
MLFTHPNDENPPENTIQPRNQSCHRWSTMEYWCEVLFASVPLKFSRLFTVLSSQMHSVSFTILSTNASGSTQTSVSEIVFLSSVTSPFQKNALRMPVRRLWAERLIFCD